MALTTTKYHTKLSRTNDEISRNNNDKISHEIMTAITTKYHTKLSRTNDKISHEIITH